MQAQAVNAIPKTIARNGVTVVRGELVMHSSELARINAEALQTGGKTYQSSRNLTAGTMKLKDAAKVATREILLKPWDFFTGDDTDLPDSNFERMQILETLGFPKYQGILVSDGSEIAPAIDAILTANQNRGIDCDGVVIKVDSHQLRKKLGVVKKFTNWMCCFKPQADSMATYLREVVWQVGRTGIITPVGICDPVILAGAEVTRVTLNNITWIQKQLLRFGAKFLMLRSGGVIPKAEKVIDEGDGALIEPPTQCPSCGAPLRIKGNAEVDSIECFNNSCPGRMIAHFDYIGKRETLEIDGLATDMATRLVTGEYARNTAELFEFQVEMLAQLNRLGDEKFAQKAAKLGFSVNIIKMLRSMEVSKSAAWDRWIPVLGIPMIGHSLGKVLAVKLKLDEDSMATLPEKLVEASQKTIEGFGDIKSKILHEWASDPSNKALCVTLASCGVRPTGLGTKVASAAGEPLKGVAFVITGTFNDDRDSVLVPKLVSLGAEEKSSVTKKVTHLIVGSMPGGSKLAKYETLKASGCPIQKVGTEWLEKVLADAGMPMRSTAVAEVEEV